MLEHVKPYCPECEDQVERVDVVDRRDFIRVVGGGAASLAGLAAVPAAGAAEKAKTAAARPAKPAEALVRELYASMTADQKSQAVLPWDHGADKGRPTRLGMYNSAILGRKIGNVYTKPQQELIDRILRAITSDEDGYRQISRGGTWDNSQTLENCGALIFGSPEDGKQFSWVFAGHHLTVRCDGNSERNAAFGGPMYYGHSPNGYSDKNIFYYQTRSVLSVFDALSEEQRKKAVVTGSPGEHAASVQFRKKHPGIAAGELTADQRTLVEKVMRDVLSPYRKEDADEVMDILRASGGLEKLHLAFYQDDPSDQNGKWDFWRLEGPGFVWNYRVLPHVHTYVNIAKIG